MAEPSSERTRWGQSLSKRKDNPEGLLEKERKQRDISETVPAYSYKKKKLNDLSSQEVEDILKCYLKEPFTQEEVARKFRIAPLLVSKLY